MQEVAVLFARKDSIYKTLSDCDVWDIERDARKWPGGSPVVGHPPCRAWGAMSHFAKPRHDEKDLARWCVDQIRQFGGVLEHPKASRLWPDKGLPKHGQRDAWGGWTYSAPQFWWGHRCEKATKFYIVGCEPKDLPSVPFVMGEPQWVIKTHSGSRGKGKKEVEKSYREKTPPDLALWLVELARRCKRD